jgi:hypothetical protein
MGILFLLVRLLSLIARISDPLGNVRTNNIWSVKAQGSLRRKLFADMSESCREALLNGG